METRWSFRTETQTEGKREESPFGKAGFKSKRWRKLTFKVSFLFLLEHLLGKPFK
jgi:hypothetical protein